MFFGKFCFEEGFLGAVMGAGELALAEEGQAGDKTRVEFWLFLELLEKDCRVEIDHELAELSGDNLAAGFLNGCAWIMYSHRRGKFNRRELNRRERKELRAAEPQPSLVSSIGIVLDDWIVGSGSPSTLN